MPSSVCQKEEVLLEIWYPPAVFHCFNSVSISRNKLNEHNNNNNLSLEQWRQSQKHMLCFANITIYTSSKINLLNFLSVLNGVHIFLKQKGLTLVIRFILFSASSYFKIIANFVFLESIRTSQEEDRNWTKEYNDSKCNVHSENPLFREGDWWLHYSCTGTFIWRGFQTCLIESLWGLCLLWYHFCILFLD